MPEFDIRLIVLLAPSAISVGQEASTLEYTPLFHGFRTVSMDQSQVGVLLSVHPPCVV